MEVGSFVPFLSVGFFPSLLRGNEDLCPPFLLPSEGDARLAQKQDNIDIETKGSGVSARPQQAFPLLLENFFRRISEAVFRSYHDNYLEEVQGSFFYYMRDGSRMTVGISLPPLGSRNAVHFLNSKGAWVW